MQLWLLPTLLFIGNINYMFRPSWPSSSVQVGPTRQLLLPLVLFQVGTVLPEKDAAIVAVAL
jgi:hypothetical protein